MPKILKIEESKIVTKRGIELQRLIFNDDKIVYVRLDNDEVYPKDVSDKYIDLINMYNASHDTTKSTKPKVKPEDFWADKNYIKDGTLDRREQISKAKNKKKLSKNRDTQGAINRMMDYGIALMVCGIIQIAISVAALLVVLGNSYEVDNVVATYIAVCIMLGVVGLVFSLLGFDIAKLKMGPTGIKTTAIVALIICVVDFLSGALGLIGLVVIIYSIIALVKVGRYEEWFYGEIE